MPSTDGASPSMPMIDDVEAGLGVVKNSLDRLVDQGYLPGYVAAVKHRGLTRTILGGKADLATGKPMRRDTQFRLASLAKPWAAVLTLRLVEQGQLTLDSPITDWLPEFEAAQVLAQPSGPLTAGTEPETVPAAPITVRHLLTQTSGYGLIVGSKPGQARHQVGEEMDSRGLVPWNFDPAHTPDDVVAGFAELPLCFQPGEGWLYHSSSDLLSVLLHRAAGPLADQIAMLCEQLGLLSTGFIADSKRLATEYRGGENGLVIADSAVGIFTDARAFDSLAGDLVGTAEDYLVFFDALARKDSSLLSTESCEAICSDQLTAEVRATAGGFLQPGCSYGYQVQVQIDANGPGAIGRFGWSGGTGTTAFADPANDLVAVLLTQRELGGPQDEAMLEALDEGLYAG